MALSEDEKVKIRHHLGFLGVAEVFTFVLGTPAAVETQFIIEGAMHRLLISTEPLVREILCRLDQLDQARQNVAIGGEVESVGNIRMRGMEAMRMIDNQLREQRGALANAFGCYVNPFDKRGGGINVPVAGGGGFGGGIPTRVWSGRR